MKKRKTYEISIIDKTYSKTISDETKFYTSDTALELAFELKETEYTFESAEIVLLNIDDRSLVTRPVVKSTESFTYEIDDDITAHYGEWRGQLRFEQAGEIYVSSPVKFRIENDLSSDRPPQLSDVQSWVSLKRYADSLIEELKQAVLSVEGIEDTFNENETVRQNQFETAEQSRQTDFEANESERDETFNTNEGIRQTQELEREKAEGARQTTFTTNEASRTETFNANEATRQENESIRQQAETQRASAESSRVSAEEQRKIDHANRSAELAGKADKVVLRNLIENGDFSSDVIPQIFSGGWYPSNKAIVEDYGRRSLKLMKSASGNTRAFIGRNDLKPNHMYLLEGLTYSLSTDGGNIWLTKMTNGASTGDLVERKAGEWVKFNFITKANSTGIVMIGGNILEGNPLYFDDVQLIDLTQTFGAGNEPSKEEMDDLIKITGYIDGEYALNNKEMLIWTLALIRRNKNAIISLGGTI